MSRQLEHLFSVYTNSLLFILSIALLLLIFEATNFEPRLQNFADGMYTSNSLPVANISVMQTVLIGCTGLLSIGLVQFLAHKEQIKLKKRYIL